MQNKQNILNFLGLAERARKLSTGESALKAVQSKTAKLVIVAEDAGPNTKKKFHDKCAFYEVDIMEWGTSAELSQAIGKINRMAIAIEDHGFAKKLKEKLGG